MMKTNLDVYNKMVAEGSVCQAVEVSKEIFGHLMATDLMDLIINVQGYLETDFESANILFNILIGQLKINELGDKLVNLAKDYIGMQEYLTIKKYSKQCWKVLDETIMKMNELISYKDRDLIKVNYLECKQTIREMIHLIMSEANQVIPMSLDLFEHFILLCSLNPELCKAITIGENESREVSVDFAVAHLIAKYNEYRK